MAKTSIEWATHVWNPFTGCDMVSRGCKRCYAKVQAPRLKLREQGRMRKAAREGKPKPKVRYQKDGDPKSSGPGFGFTVHWDKLENPSIPPPGSRVFVNSMSDVFHPEAPYDAIAKMFGVFASNPKVNWLVLTKRPERMAELLARGQFKLDATRNATADTLLPVEWPLPNVWLGTSIENRHFISRADHLRATPAAVRFISAEPLVGPLIHDDWEEAEDGEERWTQWSDGKRTPDLDLTGIDWLIAGGESGPGHEAMDVQWVRDLNTACQEANTAFFFKQLGGQYPGDELDSLPVDLRIRDFPRAASLAGTN